MDKEEKGSDVNLAVHLVYDATMDSFDTALVISNDSDLATAIKITRRKLKKSIFLSNPQRFKGKKMAAELKRLRTPIKEIRLCQLENSLLPDEVEIKEGKILHRPPSWL